MARKVLEGIGYSALGVGFLFQAAKAFDLFGLGGAGGNGRVFSGAMGGPGKPLRGLAGPESEAMQRAGGIIKSVTTRTVRDIRDRVSYIQAQIRKDSLKPEIREKALAVLTRKCETREGKVYCVPEKDYDAEIRALFTAVRDANSDLSLRYTRDHVEVDQYHSADKLLKLGGGDCFVKGTLVLRDDHRLVPVESVRPGDRIWGYNRWSRVENTWEKGALPTWKIGLNNGSSMRLTPDHKVYVAHCAPLVERALVRDLAVGDVLLRPDQIPFGSTTPDTRHGDAEKLLRVASIERDDAALPVFDIATDDHYVYLPEADWTVSNCDDGSILLGAMLRAVGYPIRLRVIQDSNSTTWSHIYLLVGTPPMGPTKWIALDWSVPGKAPGWEAPGAKQVALNGKPAGVVTRLIDFSV